MKPEAVPIPADSAATQLALPSTEIRRLQDTLTMLRWMQQNPQRLTGSEAALLSEIFTKTDRLQASIVARFNYMKGPTR